MDIQINSINFSCRTNILSAANRRQRMTKFVNKFYTTSNTFTRTTFNIDKDLKKIRLREKINEGRHAEVYSTNYDGYVVRLLKGKALRPHTLIRSEDPNGLILAEDQNHEIKLMKFIKGEPLYGKGWDIQNAISKTQYMREFERIQSLPDETFAQYIREVIKIRQNGYNIDDVNPNNFLLEGQSIGIVDLDDMPDIRPNIYLQDFDPLVNRYHLLKILSTMNRKEILKFSDKIKNFYDRIIRIAESLGYNIYIQKINEGFANTHCLINYLYYKNWGMIAKLLKSAK